MSIVYEPIKGKAGTIKFSLVRCRTAGVPIVPAYVNTIYLNVTDFNEEVEESSLNETYESINGRAGKNHFGYRQVVSFTAINSPKVPVPEGTTKTNLRAIQELIVMINAINMMPKDYYMRLQYRDNDYLASMPSVIYTGKPSVGELSKGANLAQDIKFEFKDRDLFVPNFGMSTDEYPIVTGEDDDEFIIVMTDEAGNPFINEVCAFSLTP